MTLSHAICTPPERSVIGLCVHRRKPLRACRTRLCCKPQMHMDISRAYKGRNSVSAGMNKDFFSLTLHPYKCVIHSGRILLYMLCKIQKLNKNSACIFSSWQRTVYLFYLVYFLYFFLQCLSLTFWRTKIFNIDALGQTNTLA